MFLRNVRLGAALALLLGAVTPLTAQQIAAIRGTVTRSGDNQPVAGVVVTLKGTTIATTTNGNGKYVFLRVPAGSQTLVFRWLGYAPVEKTITVSTDQTVDAELEPKAVALGDLTVTAASKEPERIVEAPAAVSSIEPRVLQATGATGQAPLALAQTAGVDIVQSGVNDFNINARGFNSSLNRRVLTLLDGRDLAIDFLGSQEWNSLTVSTEDMRGMELVRGPGSALYGPNAFAGVLNMTTLSPREALGGRVSASVGGLSSKKVDGRLSALFGAGRYGIRVTGGYSTSDTWSRSRTSIDSVSATGSPFSFALRSEYKEAITGATDLVIRGQTPELRALAGQTCGGVSEACAGSTRRPKGDRDLINSAYGAVRLDRYFGSNVVTLEGGASQVEGEVLVTGIGRAQVGKTRKPFLRAAYNSGHLNVFGYMNRRESIDTTYLLNSGNGLMETGTVSHIEAQGNQTFLDGKFRVIGGASYRNYALNTFGTLMGLADDDRSDAVKSVFGQGELRIGDKVRLVGAARYDEGDLFEGQVSPKGAIVFTPNDNHAFRFTVNKAFQTANYSEFFLRANAGAPVNFSALEAGLRANAQLGPALAGVPQGQLFTNSASVPVLARGNAALDVEKTTGYEVGYKGALSEKVYVTVDLYQNNITGFITDLLPGVNSAFPYWTAPAAVPGAAVPGLIGAIKAQLGANPATALAAAGLTRDENGNTAVLVSYTNAGDVDQKGLDVGVGVQLTSELRADATFSFFDFTVNSQRAGDQLLPNTPDRKATLGLTYEGARNGLNASLSSRFVASYDWAAGVFVGRVPAQQQINATIGFDTGEGYRLFANGVNILDQQRYQMFGGAVIGRRVMFGVSTLF
ncbi:MAG: TonB-dependent receptor [Gemmatimonadetes bacterium]|nr:TonB-dependent receptor [Gemmatimonadota bacterium]